MRHGPVRAAIHRMITVRWRLRIWAALAILFGLLIGLVPLFSVLGFELAIAAALLGSVAGLDIGCAFAKELQRAELAPASASSALDRATWPGRRLARATVAAAGLAVAVMPLPVPICAVRGLWVPTCDWWFGIVSYVAMPVLTTALAAALGHTIGVLVGPRRFVAGALCIVAWLVVAIAAFWRFYTEPPVFTYNAILGYFPGNLYDEHVQLKAAFWWSRLEQLAWVVAFVGAVATQFDVPLHRVRLRVARPAGRRWRSAGMMLVGTAFGVGLHLSSGTLAYAVDAEDIEEVLGGRYETEHFIIYYANHPNIAEDIELIARDHEFRYAQIVAQTEVAPAGKIRSFYFADREQKAELFGPRDVQMAKPWQRGIFLEHGSFPHSSLRHEIAHAVASEFGDPIFGIAAGRVLGLPVLISGGLIEGLAVALDWPAGYERPTAHESVRAMQMKGNAPKIADLLGLGFLTFPAQRGYTTAGSFLRFLLDRYGAAKVRTLYETGGDFEHAFGLTRGEVQREWYDFLSRIEVPASLVEALAERFRTGSVFQRPCPHAIAKRRERAAQADREGDRGRAIELMRQVCKDAAEEPSYRIELANYLYDDGTDAEIAEAEKLWSEIATAESKHVTSSLRARALETLSVVAYRRGDLARAKQLVDEALALPIEINERRGLENKRFATNHQGPAARQLRDYAFSARNVDSLELAETIVKLEPQLGQGHYLLGLQRIVRQQWAGAATSLAKSLELGLPHLSFVKNAARRLAVVSYRANDRGGLARAIAVLAGDDMSTGDKLLARDWSERLEFDKRHPR